MPRIYTRTGDVGSSQLFTGERRPKHDPVFEALGNLDELNSAVGAAREALQESLRLADLHAPLTEIQCLLIDIGSVVANPPTSEPASSSPKLDFSFDTDGEHVKALEQLIDVLDDKLPTLTNFILPSGGPSSCALHHARTLCRRAERSLSALYASGQCPDSVFRYMNRLSDFFFVAARTCAHRTGRQEVIYSRRRPNASHGSSADTALSGSPWVPLLIALPLLAVGVFSSMRHSL